jgi:hypothetical protein
MADRQVAALYANAEAAPPATTVIVERAGTLRPVPQATTESGTGSKWWSRLIEGDVWGASGYYPAKVLEADGPTTWPAGTQVYFDHPTETEVFDRPERSVRDLAGVIATDPVYEGDGLYSVVEFYSWAAPIVKELAPNIGLSVRANGVLEQGEAAGRRGPIVRGLMEGQSVDVVTKAGAGGKLVALLESARHSHVEEAWDGSAAMSHAAHSEHPASAYQSICAGRKEGDPEKQSSWALPHHDTPGGPPNPDGVRAALSRLPQTQGLTNAEAARKHLQAHLAQINSGSQSESHPPESQEGAMSDPITETAGAAPDPTPGSPPATTSSVTYTTPTVTTPSTIIVPNTGTVSTSTNPVAEATTPPAAPAAVRSEEETMSQPTGAAAAAPPTNPRQVMEAQVAGMRRELAEMRAQNRARDIITEVLASGWIGEAQRARLTGQLVQGVPLTDTAELDEAALRTRCQKALDVAETEAAELLQAAGVGSPRGLGALTTPATESASAASTAKLEESFKALGLSDTAAQIAVKGR